MNYHLDGQIKNMIIMVRTFNQNCKLATLQDDGTTDKEEAKTLKRIQAASEKFIKELEKVGK